MTPASSPHRWPQALLLAALFGATAWGSIALSNELGRVSSIWLANGLLVGALLLAPGNRTLLLACSFVANLGVNLLIGDPPGVAFVLASANLIEVAIALRAVRNELQGAADFLKPALLWRFVGFGVLLAPAVASCLCATLLHFTSGDELPLTFIRWYRADALGMAVMVPLLLAMRPADVRETIRASRRLGDSLALLLLVAITAMVFTQSTYPLLFMIFPPLLLVTFRLGFVGSACGIFLISAIALLFTVAGSGPFMFLQELPMTKRIVAMQLLVSTLIVTTYPVCAVILGQRRLLSSIAESEERFRVIAENSSDIVALTDVSGAWRYLSPAVTTFFGWSAEELVGRNGMDFVHPEDADVYARGSKRLSTGRDTLTGEFRMRHKEGHYVWVETISRLLRDPATGKPTGWVSNTRDISARRRMEQMKDEFVSTVNHELRTPLTAMLGAIGLAHSGRFGVLSAQLKRLLEIVKTNGDRLASLVNDILDFEKVSSGKMRFDLKPQCVAELLERSVLTNRPYADEHGITLQLQAVPLDLEIPVDDERFLQIMANLLSNAAKFSQRGASVQIEAAAVGKQCRISVIDHGVGIPAAFRSVLFERFAQADGSDNRAKGGTGLGMAIAKHMTVHMGGRISFESEENVGTTFHLEFPLVTSRGEEKN